MKNCPCDSGKTYTHCCGRFIDTDTSPQTPLELMRSRYTAYTLANMDYIQKTQRGLAAQTFEVFSAKKWAESSRWLGLDIIEAPNVSEADTEGFVTFSACYEYEGKKECLTEKSRFGKINDKWYYTSGEQA